MGVRLYNQATGRFLQADPVYGGSCNTYDYACADPINGRDLDGKRCRLGKWFCKKAEQAERAAKKVWDGAKTCLKKWYKCVKMFEEWIIVPLVLLGMIAVLVLAAVIVIGAIIATIEALEIAFLIYGLIHIIAGIIIIAYLLYRVIREMVRRAQRAW